MKTSLIGYAKRCSRAATDIQGHLSCRPVWRSAFRRAATNVIRREGAASLGPERLSDVLATEVPDAPRGCQGSERLARVYLPGGRDRLNPRTVAHVRTDVVRPA